MPSAPDLEQYFSINREGNATGIHVGQQGDLDRQARLTELLTACSPYYRQPGTVGSSELLQVIESTLGVLVGIASFGPSAADKRVPVVY